LADTADDEQLWLAIVQENAGFPNAYLCELVADFSIKSGTTEAYSLLRDENEQLTVISEETALKFLELEQIVWPLNGLSLVQEKCIGLLAASWHKLDTDSFQESLTKLDPRVLASILKQAIQKAKNQIQPNKVSVTGAGNQVVNGIYIRRGSPHDPVPKFVLADGHWNGEDVEFTLFPCMTMAQTWKWCISIADEEQPGTDRDIDFYLSTSRPAKTPLPPATGWRCLQHEPTQSLEPAPTLELLFDDDEDTN